MNILYQGTICILISSVDPVMAFTAFFFPPVQECPGSGIMLRCHVSSDSFNLEYFYSLSLPFTTFLWCFGKTCSLLSPTLPLQPPPQALNKLSSFQVCLLFLHEHIQVVFSWLEHCTGDVLSHLGCTISICLSLVQFIWTPGPGVVQFLHFIITGLSPLATNKQFAGRCF